MECVWNYSVGHSFPSGRISLIGGILQKGALSKSIPEEDDTDMTILQSTKRFIEFRFNLEVELEDLIRAQSTLFFGKDTIFISTKRKLTGSVLGDSVPDGFLFDLADLENPEFYLVEVELQKHDFYRHIFPQVTKFFGFFRNSASQNKLVEQLYSIIDSDAAIKDQFKRILGNREIFKFLKDICEDSQNILLVIDGIGGIAIDMMQMNSDSPFANAASKSVCLEQSISLRGRWIYSSHFSTQSAESKQKENFANSAFKHLRLGDVRYIV